MLNPVREAVIHGGRPPEFLEETSRDRPTDPAAVKKMTRMMVRETINCALSLSACGTWSADESHSHPEGRDWGINDSLLFAAGCLVFSPKLCISPPSSLPLSAVDDEYVAEVIKERAAARDSSG